MKDHNFEQEDKRLRERNQRELFAKIVATFK